MIEFGLLFRSQNLVELGHRFGVDGPDLCVQLGVLIQNLVDLGLIIGLHGGPERYPLISQLGRQRLSVDARLLEDGPGLVLLIRSQTQTHRQPMDHIGMGVFGMRIRRRLGRSGGLGGKNSRHAKGKEESTEFHCFRTPSAKKDDRENPQITGEV
jgi:hypothetical protein